jgi:hypothetical protein
MLNIHAITRNMRTVGTVAKRVRVIRRGVYCPEVAQQS